MYLLSNKEMKVIRYWFDHSEFNDYHFETGESEGEYSGVNWINLSNGTQVTLMEKFGLSSTEQEEFVTKINGVIK